MCGLMILMRLPGLPILLFQKGLDERGAWDVMVDENI
jgi:hypothetical protein